MSSPLEKFILENRDKFDADTPDTRVWEKINERLNPETEKITPVRTIPFKRWMAAAAAVVVVGLTGVLYFSMHPKKQVEVAVTDPGKPIPDNDQQKAIADFNGYLRQYPNDADAYLYRAMAYHRLGQNDNAATDLRRCLDLTNDPMLRTQAEQQLRVVTRGA